MHVYYWRTSYGYATVVERNVELARADALSCLHWMQPADLAIIRDTEPELGIGPPIAFMVYDPKSTTQLY